MLVFFGELPKTKMSPGRIVVERQAFPFGKIAHSYGDILIFGGM